MLIRAFWMRSTGFPFDLTESLALSDPADALAAAPEFDRQVAESSRMIASVLTDPRAAEAIFLSNPAAADRLDSLARTIDGKLTSRSRQRLRLAWRYLQRLCAKNETYSYFGPLAWGWIDFDVPAAIQTEVIDPDGGQIRRNRVRIEYWVTDRLCRSLCSHPRLAELMPLRLHPHCDVVGTVLRHPPGQETRLTAPTAALLEAAGGTAPLTGQQRSSPAAARLTAAGVLSAVPAGPPGADDPLTMVIEALRPMAADPVVFRLSTAARQLAILRGQFERAGYPQRRQLAASMDAVLDSAQISTHRPKGQLYTGRFPVYEDCERNIKVTLGRPIADELTAGVEPLMRLYKATALVAAARLHEHYLHILGQLQPDRTGDADFVEFISAARGAQAQRALADVVADLRSDLTAIWAKIVTPGSTTPVELNQADIDAVRGYVKGLHAESDRFSDVLGVGLVSPDLLLAGASEQAIRDGRWRLDIGEVHAGVAMVLQPVALPFLDDRSALINWANRYLTPGRIQLASSGASYQRSCIEWPVLDNLWEIVLAGAPSRCRPARQIPAGRGRVITDHGIVTFLDRLTGRTDDMVTVLSTDLHRVLFAAAGDVLGGSVPQRLQFGRVRVKRRSWRLVAGDGSGPPSVSHPAENADDYRALVRWAQQLGLPRNVFVRSAAEPKPVYVDWQNPLAVDVFAKLTSNLAEFQITEMSPQPTELWLADAAGRYCSELRMTFAV